MILIEIVVRMPLATVGAEINAAVSKSLHTITSKSISDHWKEKVVLVYACRLLTATFKLTGLLLAIAAIALALIYAFDRFAGASVGSFIVTWIGILFSVLVATVYFAVRKRVV